jgi:hypothetical protein
VTGSDESGWHHVADDSAPPTLLLLRKSLSAQWNGFVAFMCQQPTVCVDIGTICSPLNAPLTLLEAECGRKDYVNDKSQWPIANRTRDLTTCSAVPQPTAPPLVTKRKIFHVAQWYTKNTWVLRTVFGRRFQRLTAAMFFLTIINSAECLYRWRLFGMWRDCRCECSSPWRGHGLLQVLHFQTDTRFHATRVNVLWFRRIREARLSLRHFARNSRMVRITECKYFYQISSKSDEKKMRAKLNVRHFFPRTNRASW